MHYRKIYGSPNFIQGISRSDDDRLKVVPKGLKKEGFGFSCDVTPD